MTISPSGIEFPDSYNRSRSRNRRLWIDVALSQKTQHGATQDVTTGKGEVPGLYPIFSPRSPLPSVQIATLLSDFVDTNLGTQTLCGFQKTLFFQEIKTPQVFCLFRLTTFLKTRPTGFEPVTLGSEDRCAIQLRHGRSKILLQFCHNQLVRKLPKNFLFYQNAIFLFLAK